MIIQSFGIDHVKKNVKNRKETITARNLKLCFDPTKKELSLTKIHYHNEIDQQNEGALLTTLDSHLSNSIKLSVYLDYNMFHANTIVFLLSVIKKLKEYQSRGKQIKMFWVNGNSNCKIEMNGISLLGHHD